MSELVEGLSHAAARRFARWNDEHFRALMARAPILAAPHARDAWARLVAEGVGTERLAPGRDNTLTHLFVDRFDELAGLPPAEQTRHLARCWNLAEALTREPEWLEAFVHASLRALTDLRALEAHLVEVVAPVLAPTAPASWTGPFKLTRLDPRTVDPDFLPGALEAIAPRVVAVRDRLRDEALALVLGRDSNRFFPLRVVPPRWEAYPPAPNATFADGRVYVNALGADLPTVKHIHSLLAMPAGQVLCAATDSQFLWLATSP